MFVSRTSTAFLSSAVMLPEPQSVLFCTSKDVVNSVYDLYAAQCVYELISHGQSGKDWCSILESALKCHAMILLALLAAVVMQR